MGNATALVNEQAFKATYAGYEEVSKLFGLGFWKIGCGSSSDELSIDELTERIMKKNPNFNESESRKKANQIVRKYQRVKEIKVYNLVYSTYTFKVTKNPETKQKEYSFVWR